MQRIIDITDDIYAELTKTGENEINLGILLALREAVRQGTTLPKGHGRIADMDEAIKCIKDVEGEDAVWAIGLIEWACGKRTIIGADKEQKS